MKINHQIVVFDAPDLQAEGSFWSAILGGTVEDPDDHWHMVHVDGTPRVGVQFVPDHMPPGLARCWVK